MAQKKANITLFKNLNLQQLQDYCDFFDKHDLEELKIEHEDVKLHLRAPEKNVPPPTMPSMSFMEKMQNMALPSFPGFPASPNGTDLAVTSSPSSSETTQSGSEKADASKEKIIEAPMTGTFYASPTPDADAYVQVGTKLTKGKKIFILEAMKIMNEIDSPMAGTIEEILVKNGQPVSKGDPIMRLK